MSLAISGQSLIASASVPSLGVSVPAAKLIFDQVFYQASAISLDAFPETKSVLDTLKVQLRPLADQLLELVTPLDHGASQWSLASKANLADITNPHYIPDASMSLRELLRVLYYNQAPDELIAEWRDVELDEKGRPTRFSRLRFAAYRNLDPELYPEAIQQQIELACSGARKAYGTLSKYLHVGDGEPLSPRDALPILEETTNDIILWIKTVKATIEARQELMFDFC